MRDRRMERFVIFPFSAGCVSQSSVAVCENQPKKAQQQQQPEPPPPRPCGERESQSSRKTKTSLGLVQLPRPNISAGFQKLIRGFKSLSQLFVVFKEDDEEIEMEIGFPTDVKHVAHIGWDGFSSVSSMKSWDRAPDVLSIPSLSLRQFELAMAARTGASPPHGPLGG